MRFLIDANMPRIAASALRELGHECVDTRDIGLSDAADSVIADFVRSNGLVLITRDWDFADIRNYPPDQYSGIVIMLLPDYATASAVAEAVRLFAQNRPILERLAGRLAIVEPGRVRIRPA